MSKGLISIALASCVLLSACGGGGNNGGAQVVGPRSNSESFNVGGTVSGLQGSLTISANGETIELNSDGAFEFSESFRNGTSINLQVEDRPFRQGCYFSDNQFVIRNDINNLMVTCSSLGTLRGVVKNYSTGAPLANSTVVLVADTGSGMAEIERTRSNANGEFSITGTGVSERFLLSATLAQYGSSTLVLSNSLTNPDLIADPLMLNNDLDAVFSGTAPFTLTVDGYDLATLPANAFVDRNNNPYSGAVSATATIIDPSSDPALMPGDYQVVSPGNGQLRPIESFGAVEYNFTDGSGNPLQLANGVSATINIPLASSVDPDTAPASIPLFYFEETTGYWVEDGSATLTSTAAGYVYAGTVSHFTYWNADDYYTSVDLVGCVENAVGRRIADARVMAVGSDYIGSSSAISNQLGEFTIPVREDSRVLLTARRGGNSNTMVVNTGTTMATLDQCLVLGNDSSSTTIKLSWGANPADLDSHLIANDLVGTNATIHVYYADETAVINDIVIDLDVDDTTSFGPEIITIPDFPAAGTYQYFVHHYSGTGNIVTSPARVELQLIDETYIFTSEQANGDPNLEAWHVFNLVVTEDMNVSVETVQQLVDEEQVENVPATSNNLRAMRLSTGGGLPAKDY